MKLEFEKYIQIAGIIDKEEAELIIECGVQYLGFPLRLPVNKEDVSASEAAEIVKSTDADANFVLITYLDSAEEIAQLCKYLSVKIVQLHGPISLDELKTLRGGNPRLTVIKSLIVRKDNYSGLVNEIKKFEPLVDAFITDTYDPSTGAEGATGKAHDWSISRKIVEKAEKPVILAGGLTPQNVREAILFVKPAGADVHTGVEDSTGRKNKALLQKFLSEAEDAFLILKSEHKK